MPNRNIFASIVILLILLAGLAAGLRLVRQKQEIRKEAAEITAVETITVETFKTHYSTMLKRYGAAKRIQVFGGGTVISEFDDVSNIYAGHLGGFWAPPYYSTHTVNALVNPQDWTKGFNIGLVIWNNGYGGGNVEQPTDLATEEAYWYPSKMVVSHLYPGGGGGTHVRGAKVALPGNTRGLALKMTYTNKTPNQQSYNILYLTSLPTFETLQTWPTTSAGWNWLGGQSARSRTSSVYDSATNTVVISDTQMSAYMAIGLSSNLHSWGTQSDPYVLYNDFFNVRRGSLSNSNSDDPNISGSAVGLVAGSLVLNSNQSATVTLIVGFGSTPEIAKQIVTSNRTSDVEAVADSYWNQRLQADYNRLPQFISGNTTLDKLYKNSILTYSMNRWDTMNSINQSFGFGQSTALFPWFTGTAGFFPLADANLWKQQLTKLLALNYDSCRAYGNLSSTHLCDTYYSYSRYTLADAVYKYVTASGDFSYLNQAIGSQTVFSRLESLISQDDARQHTSGLVHFGTDSNMYEYNTYCDKGGQYVGYVISPNAERAVIHEQLAELADKLGNPTSAAGHRNKAAAIKNSIQQLWNPSRNWFDTITYFDGSTPVKNTTFRNIAPYLLFQYDVLTPSQKTALYNQIDQFIHTYGFTSLPKSDITQTCRRTDWHGPGLYSGAVGSVLTGLYKNGYQDKAYSVLYPSATSGYSYLAEMPYFSQAFDAYNPVSSMSVGYLEGLSLAQSFIQGMFGVEPNTDHTAIAPRIPGNLLALGPVQLNSLKMQGHIWDIKVNSASDHQLTMNVNKATSNPVQANAFRFGYTTTGNLSFQITNLTGNTYYSVTAAAYDPSKPAVTAGGYSTSTGVLTLSLLLNGKYVIKGVASAPPSATPTPTPLSSSTPTPTICPLPPSPTGLSPNGTLTCGTTSVTFRWNTASGASEYGLRIDDLTNPWNDNCSPNLGDTCQNVSGTSYTRPVVPGRTYNWWVHSLNSCGWSQGSTASLYVPVCPTNTPTPTPTRTPTPTLTTTPTPIPTRTPTPTRTPSPTPTRTPTPSPTRTPTPTLIVTVTSTPCIKQGDANADCKVDGFDYVIWWQNFNRQVSAGPSQGDFNTSGFVDGFDYVIWWMNFGR